MTILRWIVLIIMGVCLRFWGLKELGDKIYVPSKFELAERYAGLAGHQNYDWFEDFNIGDVLTMSIGLMLFAVLVGGEQDKVEAYLALAQGDWENIIESEGVA